MRLVSSAIHARWIAKAELYDWHGALPQWNSLPAALILSAVQRSAGYWRIFVVDDTRSAFRQWLGGKPVLPTWQYNLAAERKIVWHNASVQRGLSVREAIVEARSLRFDSIAGIEVLAYSVGTADTMRIWFADRSKVDGLELGVDPRRIKAARKSPHFEPNVTDDLRRHAQALHDQYHQRAGKTARITKTGTLYV